jgi:glycosyltransferase involved in cell wall biosynthesis
MTLHVAVVVASTRTRTLPATLRSLGAQTHRDWHVVVVAQYDVSALRAVAEHEVTDTGRLQFIAMEGHGLSRARNAALRAASGEVVAMIDDDCEADPRWLEALANCFVEDPRVGIVGGAVDAPPPVHGGPRNCPRCEPVDTFYDPGMGDVRPKEWGWIGANFALRKEAATRIGEFDELLGAGTHFPVGEDVDYMLRAEALGIRMRTTPAARVCHTYGWRYGIVEVMRHQRGYARGNGALAAKLTLSGDERGVEAMKEMRRLARRDWLERRSPVALPAGLRRLYHFVAGYRECLAGFCVDARGLLTPRDAVAAP